MNLETLRAYCLSLPYVAENVQWDEHLVFRIEDPASRHRAKSSKRNAKSSKDAAPKGKIFCIANISPVGACTSFKCSPESFAELLELPHIIPAPYLARNHWVALERWDALPNEEFRQHVKHSYGLVWEKLPKSTRQQLTENVAEKKQSATASKQRHGKLKLKTVKLNRKQA